MSDSRVRAASFVQFFPPAAASQRVRSARKRHRRVGAAATRCRRRAADFLQMNANAVGNFSRRQEMNSRRGGRDFSSRSAVRGGCTKVEFRFRPRSKVQFSSQTSPGCRTVSQLVKAIGAFGEVCQEQVDLAGRFFSRRMRFHQKQKRGQQFCRRVCGKTFHGQFVEHLEAAARNPRRDIAPPETSYKCPCPSSASEYIPGNIAFRSHRVGEKLFVRIGFCRRMGKVTLS